LTEGRRERLTEEPLGVLLSGTEGEAPPSV